MPKLSEISYSHEACVAAVRDYYRFLVQLYLDESAVVEPPEDGWLEITDDSLRTLGKDDTVISLLRHLPYIRDTGTFERPQAVPFCAFADWHTLPSRVDNNNSESDYLKLVTEGEFADDIPPSVVGLTEPPRNDTLLFLDTRLGVVYWPECWGEITSTAPREEVYDDPFAWAPEREADWRVSSAVWAIEDFFEVLKEQFRELRFVPVSPWQVLDVFTGYQRDDQGLVPMLQDIYRSHGWPDLERYNKRDCLRNVKAALEKHYPDYAEFW